MQSLNHPQPSPLAPVAEPARHAPAQFDIFNVRIDNLREQEAIARVLDGLGPHATPTQMCFVNAHCLNVAYADAAYDHILREARNVFADGIGVKLAARMRGVEVLDNVNGTDLFPKLCAAMEGTEHSIYLLGAQPGKVDAVVAWLRQNYPDLRIAGAHHGYFNEAEEPAVIERIRASGAHLLLVAMGVPRQEKWIARHLEACGVRVAIGVGALFDFYSQTVPRAPMWMRRAGLEWMYRLMIEPGRMWRRYVVGNPQFLWRVMMSPPAPHGA